MNEERQAWEKSHQIEQQYFNKLGLTRLKSSTNEVVGIKNSLIDLENFYYKEGGPFILADRFDYFIDTDSRVLVFVQTYMPKILLDKLIEHSTEFELKIEYVEENPFGGLVSFIKVWRS